MAQEQQRPRGRSRRCAVAVALVLAGAIVLFFTATTLVLVVFAPPVPPTARASPPPHASKLLLLLASAPSSSPSPLHSKLAWYDPAADTVVLEPVFPKRRHHHAFNAAFSGDDADDEALWVAINNNEQQQRQPQLVELGAEERRRVALPPACGRVTAAARAYDRVYVACDGDGGAALLALAFPSMALLQRLALPPSTSVTALAPLARDELWVATTTTTTSSLLRVDVAAALTAARIDGVAARALVTWPPSSGAATLLVLGAASLVLLDARTGAGQELWRNTNNEAPLNGLAVVDDVAYFGAAGDLAAFDLARRRLLWRRRVVFSEDDAAAVALVAPPPWLGADAAHAASYTLAPPPPPPPPALLLDGGDGGDGGGSGVANALAALEAAGWPACVSAVDAAGTATRRKCGGGGGGGGGGFWASGLPRLALRDKAGGARAAGLALPMARVDVRAAQAALRALPEALWTPVGAAAAGNAVVTGRDANMERVKPGVQSIILMFSARGGGDGVYEFPLYAALAPTLEPLLGAVLGAARGDTAGIIRLQLARLRPGAKVRAHVDAAAYAAAYAAFSHRIHVPLLTHDGVRFDVCPPARAGGGHDGGLPACVAIPAWEGLVFELNNRLPHAVSMTAADDDDRGGGGGGGGRERFERVHLVVDVAEAPRARVRLPLGSVCSYTAAEMQCYDREGQRVEPPPSLPAAYYS